MAIQIKLPEELEQALLQRAEVLGVNVNELISKIIKQELDSSHLSDQESRLLEQVSIGFSEEFWNRYSELQQKKKDESLTKEEFEELIQYSNQIEERNAARLPAIFQLAELQGKTPSELIQDLGLQ